MAATEYDDDCFANGTARQPQGGRGVGERPKHPDAEGDAILLRAFDFRAAYMVLVSLLCAKHEAHQFNLYNIPSSKATPPNSFKGQARIHIAPYLRFNPRFV